MREITHNILEDPSKFQLILLPCTVYQKKDGTTPVQKSGFFHDLVEKYSFLPASIGKSVEKYGNCPAILESIPNTKFPTKFGTFPVTPTSLRVENPDDVVYSRLKGKFKKYSLLPGWTLLPRSDMVEFSCIKLLEIMKYYKLSQVALPFEMFAFDREDESDYLRTASIIQKFIPDNLYLVFKPRQDENIHGNIVQTTYSEKENG